MILVDTNVISEAMRAEPSRRVLNWLNQIDAGALFISAVTIGEIEYGLCSLPDGRRRASLRERFEQFIARAFAYRILPFGEDAASTYGDLMAERRRAGRPMSAPDGQIAATARTAGLSLATRNVRDFEDCGIDLINPFD